MKGITLKTSPHFANRRPMQKRSGNSGGKPSSAISPTFVSLLDDQKLITVREDLLVQRDNVGKYDRKTLQLLVTHLKENSKLLAVQGQYKESRSMTALAAFVKDYLERAAPQAPSNTLLQDLDVKIRALNAEYAAKLAEFDGKRNERVAELEKRHQEELAEFEEEWTMHKPNEYRKCSKKLLEMKHVQKSLVLTGDIERAQELDGEIMELTAEENILAQRKLNTDYTVNRDVLSGKQTDEMEKLLTEIANERDLLDTAHNRELKVLENRRVVLQKKPMSMRLTKSTNENNSVYYGQSIASILNNKNWQSNLLLPPLLPPTDPKARRVTTATGSKAKTSPSKSVPLNDRLFPTQADTYKT